MSQTVLTNVFPDLIAGRESLELSRFVLLDPVPANAETWFMTRCFEHLAVVGVGGVVAFADPIMRTAADGTVVCPGHRGVIYMAKSGHYLGRSTPRTNAVLPDGTVLSARAAQKVRRSERGRDYVVRRLVALGAPNPGPGAGSAAWLRQALAVIGARQQRHPGCHRYAFAVGHNARQHGNVRIAGSSLPYPPAASTPDGTNGRVLPLDWSPGPPIGRDAPSQASTAVSRPPHQPGQGQDESPPATLDRSRRP